MSELEHGRYSGDGFQKCPDCGRFCGVVYRSRGASEVEVASCVYCGRNPPKCGHEDGSVYGCQQNATHEVPGKTHGRWWCEEHAPEDAEILPYADGGESGDSDE